MKNKILFYSMGVVTGVALFVGTLGVLAAWPGAPDGSSIGGWLGEFFDLQNSGSGKLIVNGHIQAENPTESKDLATKEYVDANGGGGGGDSVISSYIRDTGLHFTNCGDLRCCTKKTIGADGLITIEEINTNKYCTEGEGGRCLNGVCQSIANIDPPTNLNVTQTPNTPYITLTWEDNSDNEQGFRIYKDDILIYTVAMNITSKKIYSTYNYNTNYKYSVVAYIVDTESSSAEKSFTLTCTTDYTDISARDGKDNDCDGTVDEAVQSTCADPKTCNIWYGSYWRATDAAAVEACETYVIGATGGVRAVMWRGAYQYHQPYSQYSDPLCQNKIREGVFNINTYSMSSISVADALNPANFPAPPGAKSCYDALPGYITSEASTFYGSPYLFSSQYECERSVTNANLCGCYNYSFKYY